METTSQQDIASHMYQSGRGWKVHSLTTYIRVHRRLAAALMLVTLLLCGSILLYLQQSDVYALSNHSGGCTQYKIHHGDTLSSIARHYNEDVWTLAQTNHISNINFIVSGTSLCIQSAQSQTAATKQSAHTNITALFQQTASKHNVPASLVMAIAWQESGWKQSAISADGGTGVMQIMPYTASWLNATEHTHYNPRQLRGNVQLGVIYLHILWNTFHGNLTDVISAYNEGAWNVTHRGIFNWGYVNSVLALMQRF